MRTTVSCAAAVFVALLAAPRAWGQAGRYVPIPRVPTGGGGGGGHFIPHVPWYGGGGGSGVDSDLFWIIVAVVGVIVLAVVGWRLGLALGRRGRPGPTRGWAPRPEGSTAFRATPTVPMQDLIFSRAEVAAKAEQTRRLLEFLARAGRPCDPVMLHQWAAMTFMLVQKAWEERDYSKMADLLMPGILGKHQALLDSMRQNHEINRIEGLRIDRLEFVHLYAPQDPDKQEVTALITFEAAVYFVDDRTGKYTRGLQRSTWFQEFWTFRRQGDGWRLAQIEQSHESDRLEAANHVAELTERQLRNAQEAITL
jgi:hypothetical protein